MVQCVQTKVPIRRGEHSPEFAKNYWEKVSHFLGSGEEFMKFRSVCVFAIWDGEVLTAWRKTFLNVKRNSTQLNIFIYLS